MLPFSSRFFCAGNHILREYPVAPCRVIDEHMGHSPDQPAVLHYRRTAHALHDTSCFINKTFICDVYHKVMLSIVAEVNVLYLRRIGLGCFAVNRGIYLRTSAVYLLLVAQLDFLFFIGRIFQFTEKPCLAVQCYLTQNFFTRLGCI